MKRKITIKSLSISLICIVFIFSLIKQGIVINKINDSITEQNKELDLLKEKNIKLQEELERAQSGDIEYLEKLARERLGLIIDGEQLVRPLEPQE